MCYLRHFPFYLLCFSLFFGPLIYMPFLRQPQYTLGGFEDTLITQSKRFIKVGVIPTFGDDFHSAILWFCTKFTLKLGVISKPWRKFPFLTLVDPYLLISTNHVRVRCYQVRGETRILLTSPTPWFSISPKFRFLNRLRTCSNWKDKYR